MLQQQSLQAGQVSEELGQFADVGGMTQHHLELNKSRGKVVTSGGGDQTIQGVELERTEQLEEYIDQSTTRPEYYLGNSVRPSLVTQGTIPDKVSM